MRAIWASVVILGLSGCGSYAQPTMIGSYKRDAATGAYLPTAQIRLHTEPTYVIAFIDDKEEVGANSTLHLRLDQDHRIELKKPGYYGQVIHLKPDPNFRMVVDPAHPMTPRAANAFLAEVENLASGERRPIDWQDPRIALEAIAQVPSGPQMPQQVIAVMPTTSRTELPSSVLDAISDNLRVAVAGQRIAVIDRGRLAEELARQVKDEKTNSYRSCVDEACQVPLGRALAATHILRSTVTKLGNTCGLSAELVDLKSELTVAAQRRDAPCQSDALVGLADELAKALMH